MSCTIDVFNLHMKIHLRWSTVANTTAIKMRLVVSNEFTLVPLV